MLQSPKSTEKMKRTSNNSNQTVISSANNSTRARSFSSSSSRAQSPILQPSNSLDLTSKPSGNRVSFDLYPSSIDVSHKPSNLNHQRKSSFSSASPPPPTHQASSSSSSTASYISTRLSNSITNNHSHSTSSIPSIKRSSSTHHMPSNGHSRGSKSQLAQAGPSSTPTNRSSTSSNGYNNYDGTSKYYAQESAYLKKIENDKFKNDTFKLPGIPDPESDSEEESDLSDAGALGGLGTSFDASNISNYSFFEATDKSLRFNDFESLHERLEWQAMLTAVLTGDVIASEKIRLSKGGKAIQEDDVLIGLRARICGRTIEQQKRIFEDNRSNVDTVLKEVMDFRVSDPKNIELCREEVKGVLHKVEQCEMLWISCKAFRKRCDSYNDPKFQRRMEALNAWHNVIGRIDEQVKLLRKWTGNDEIDPTKPSDTKNHSTISEPTTLADRILKQKDPEDLFKTKLEKNIEPVVTAARNSFVEYSEDMEIVGLPLQKKGLEIIISFLMILIHEIIRSRLEFSQKMSNPSPMLTNQTMEDISLYLKIASIVKERTASYIAPLTNGAQWVDFQPDPEFDKSILACIEYFFQLSESKLLATPVHYYGRAFKDIETLENQYMFLDSVSKQIKGGRSVVATLSSSLASKMVTSIIKYWERQKTGPVLFNETECQRWQSSTTEQVRKAHRKLLRFYHILSTNYENSAEFSFHTDRFKILFNSLTKTNHFLVIPTQSSNQDVFVIAEKSLANDPTAIAELLQGYSHKGDFNSEKEIEAPKYLIVFKLTEPLAWEGDLVEVPIENIEIELDPGRMRLVCEGGAQELIQVRKNLKNDAISLDNFEVINPSFSSLSTVDNELNRMKRFLYKLSATVISDTCHFRKTFKDYPDIVQNMFMFAKDFGQRGINLMNKSRKGNIAFRLGNLCIEWLSFICDDCVPTDLKTYRWTVTAIEFTLLLTQGVNIIALSNEQFTQLRLRVAGCMTLLILHFDIMGARSTAARIQRQTRENKPNAKDSNVQDDSVLLEEFHRDAYKRLALMEENLRSQQNKGKVLDESDSNAELVTYLASNFSRMSIRWQQGQFIGGGSFGSVYTAMDLDSGEIMAVKEIRMQDPNSMRQALKSIKDEMTVLEMLHHPNIVHYFGVEVHRDRVFIFMEYCQGGSLARLLEYGRIEDESVVQVYTMQMLEGLAYLHQKGVVHRDVKPENVLLDHMGIIKFVDFGAAKVIAKRGQSRHGNGNFLSSINKSRSDGENNATTKLNSMIGTPMYMSPEVITGKCEKNLQSSIDIWSLGCCVLEMATGRRPWANLDNEWAIMYHIAAGHLPQLPACPDQLSELGIQFLLRALEREPRNRPTAMTLLQDPWISMIRVSQGIENPNAQQLAGTPPTPPISSNNTPSISTSLSSPSFMQQQQQ